MSSVNPHYTFEYSQPEEYHFSHDSVFLARQVYEIYRDEGLAPATCLDLCAGCGIIGLDFLFHNQKERGVVPRAFDFLEVQSEIYQDHFSKNSKHVTDSKTNLNFVGENYDVLQAEKYKNQYDLILCNPPYFHRDQGTLSPSDFKNRCRFFIDSDFANLMRGIENSLRPGGRAYVLLREQRQHGWSAFHLAGQHLSSVMSLEILGDIRGTSLLEIRKAN
ncbi:methyltransferase [Bdellovibrio sp. HCB288]|uniref:methyltransferase n=1 Tax=Bdellovibrio sp. HCB288 TaxID=3394355 RepID=UPI0039B40A77